MLRILVLYLSIGSGHQVAAEAITAALRRANVEAICTDPIAEHSRVWISLMNLGNSLSGLMIPRLYNKLWSNGRASPLTNWMTTHGFAVHPIRSAIDAIKPDRIVCTHALPARVAAQHKRQAQVIGVVTDFGAHAYWPHPLIDRYCVPVDDVGADLIKRGIDLQRIHVTGLPTLTRLDRAGRSNDRVNVLIVIGGRRAGPYRRAAQLIIKALPQLDLPIRITIVTGANQTAHRQLSSLKLPDSIELLGIVDDLPTRLSRADIVIGKPGGVLTAEVLAAGAAFIAITPGPGQETANAEFLQRHLLAMICHRPDELINAVVQLAADTALRQHMQQAAQHFGRPNAADDVAQIVLSTCHR